PPLLAALRQKISPMAVVTAIATTSATVGSQPRCKPLDVPPGPPRVARLPRITPAIPNRAVWASETMPPYAERKIRLAAAMPNRNVSIRIWWAQYWLKTSGPSAASTSAVAPTPRSIVVFGDHLSAFHLIPASQTGPAGGTLGLARSARK